MPSLEDSRARLVDHFEGDNVKKGSKWDELWAAGEFLPWDRSMPNPALEDLLFERRDLLPAPFSASPGGPRRRALVPGCGAGYDVLLLASFGYDTYGLEVSQAAVKRCLQEQERNGDKYPPRDKAGGTGKATFVNGNFFDGDWLTKAGGNGKFDIIYDYTVSIVSPFFGSISFDFA